jgi:hypothetical protein
VKDAEVSCELTLLGQLVVQQMFAQKMHQEKCKGMSNITTNEQNAFIFTIPNKIIQKFHLPTKTTVFTEHFALHTSGYQHYKQYQYHV